MNTYENNTLGMINEKWILRVHPKDTPRCGSGADALDELIAGTLIEFDRLSDEEPCTGVLLVVDGELELDETTFRNGIWPSGDRVTELQLECLRDVSQAMVERQKYPPAIKGLTTTD